MPSTASLLLFLSLAATAAPAQAPRAIEVTEATVAELQQAMADGRATSEGLVGAYLARIAAYDQRGPAINAMIRLDPRARAEARRLDAERRAGRVRGPLHGIPIILKDNFDTADLPTSGGALGLAAHRTRDDAFVVRRLREAGAVILGKANMHELAAGITTVSSLGGQTRNPYDPRRCPGGSSGGTGAAIAASFAAVGWGSDTCGSIRIPAAFGALAGLRPTQGLVSRTGVMPLSHTQDIAGPLARTVADLAIALDATVGMDAADSATRVLAGRALPRFADSLRADALRGARVGVLTNYLADADAEIVDSVRAAVRAMRAAGADTTSVSVPWLDTLLAGTGVINYEHKFDLADYLARPGSGGGPATSLASLLATGLHHDALEARYRLADTTGTRDSPAYRRALARQQAARTRIVALLDSLRLDALVYPTMRRRPTLVGEPQLGTTCQLAAQTGLPALSVPAGFTADGLPVGVELLGRPFGDARLVAMGYAFERLGARRRAPFSTPPLVRGRAPAPAAFTVVAGSAPGAARARFAYDRVRGTLDYDVAVSGDRVQAVVLRRRGAGPGADARVVQRFAGPGASSAAGSLPLAAVDRAALLGGALALAVVDTAGGVRETPLRVPAAARDTVGRPR